MIFENISDDTSQMENFQYSYPHSNALLQSHLKLEHCKSHKTKHLPTKCDLINNVKLFLTVYRRIYCRNFFTYPIRRWLQKQVHLNVIA